MLLTYSSLLILMVGNRKKGQIAVIGENVVERNKFEAFTQ